MIESINPLEDVLPVILKASFIVPYSKGSLR
jgi:hypothetical protein